MGTKRNLNRIPRKGQGPRSALKAALRRSAMGEIRANVRLENIEDRVLCKKGLLADKDVRVHEVDCVADTGAVLTLLPQDLVEALGLETLTRVVVALAN